MITTYREVTFPVKTPTFPYIMIQMFFYVSSINYSQFKYIPREHEVSIIFYVVTPCDARKLGNYLFDAEYMISPLILFGFGKCEISFVYFFHMHYQKEVLKYWKGYKNG